MIGSLKIAPGKEVILGAIGITVPISSDTVFGSASLGSMGTLKLFKAFLEFLA
jgi:hypothetical protein